MKQEQIQYIRNVLVRKMDELQGASNKMVKEMKKESMKLADPLDRAAVELDRTVTLIMRDRDRKLIQNIRETLTRIDEGLFGLCDDCGETLPTKRILAAPLSRLCKHCQEKKEHMEKQKDKGTFLPTRGHAYVERNLRSDPDPDPDLPVALGIQNSAGRRMADPVLHPRD
jgi:DnaK suppressor protein